MPAFPWSCRRRRPPQRARGGDPLGRIVARSHLPALLAVGVLSCGSPAGSTAGEGTSGPSNSEEFAAVAGDFTGFHSWESFDTTGGAALAGIHDGSTVTEYLNRAPATGAKEFPVGTIIVKEATGGTIPHELFAMVKRGGSFNSGAPGWEWFDLSPVAGGKDTVTIVWRGFGPPAGDTYGGDAKAGCNACHTACGNDAVCAEPLALSNF
jgi:hypothetical protein